MFVAVILSSPADLAIALACAARLRSFGWVPRLLLDDTEWPDGLPDGLPEVGWSRYAATGRMYGNACHEAILDGVLALSDPGDLVMKTDCDVGLTGAGAEWFGGCTSVARGLMWRGRRWGGAWAARREQVARLREHAHLALHCECAESHLALCGLHHHGGLELYERAEVATWIEGKGFDSADAPAYTLPLKIRRMHRLRDGLALFGSP